MSDSQSDFLPFHRSWFEDDEINEVVDTLKSGWLTTGPKTRQFEEDFRDYTDCGYAVAVNSCTAALHLAFATQPFERGDEVITSPMTFPATVNPAIHLGLKPVFADIEPGTMNLDPEKIEERITPRTRFLLPVHFAGHACDIDRLKGIAERHQLTIIEDGAHAIGAGYRGKKIGGHGNPVAFSFYANKNITTGEGGMLALPDAELEEEARVLRLQGISKDAWKRYSKEGFAHYELQTPGYKYNMADLNAALGIHQLKKVERFQEIRVHYANQYTDAFAAMEEVETPEVRHYADPAWHIYVLALNLDALTISRDEFLNAMQDRGIGMAVHYRALHLQPYFKNHFDYSLDDLPLASSYSDRIVSLPLYPRMSEEDVNRVIDTVQSVLKQHRR